MTSIYKVGLATLLLSFSLAQAQPAHAQSAQLIQAATQAALTTVRTIPKLIKAALPNSNNKNGQASGSQSAAKQTDSSGAAQSDADAQQPVTTGSVHGQLAPHLDPSAGTSAPQLVKVMAPPAPPLDMASYCLDTEQHIKAALAEQAMSPAKSDVVVAFEIDAKGNPRNIHVYPQGKANDSKIQQEAIALINRSGPFGPLSPALSAMTKLKVHVTEVSHSGFREYNAEVESTINPHSATQAQAPSRANLASGNGGKIN